MINENALAEAVGLGLEEARAMAREKAWKSWEVSQETFGHPGAFIPEHSVTPEDFARRAAEAAVRAYDQREAEET